jgi:hypothetical protein
MSMMEPTCSEHSLATGEPLAGTAVAGITHWVVIEHATPWGPKGLEDSGLPEPLVHHLGELARSHPQLRVQLARKAERSDAAPTTRVFFATCDEGPGTLRVARLARADDLRALALEPWLRGEQPSPGDVEREPLLLVCVHGKRDRCCARLGLPVYRALVAKAGERVLQTTHLGGHRFAATLLVLPSGLCYGRVQPDEVEALLEATVGGAIHDLARLRGRCCYASEAQAAEIALREQLGDRRSEGLRLCAIDALAADHYRVRFREREGAREHEVELRRAPRAPAPASCGAAPKPGHELLPLRTSASR